MSRTETTKAVITSLNAIATVFVILRVVSRFGVLKKPSADDHLILFGLILSWILTGLVYAQGHFGLGKHQDQVSHKDFQYMLLCLYIYIPIYNVTLTVVKLSALFQFLRFFTMPKTRAAAWVLIAVVSMYGISVPIVSLCSCRPIAAFWNRAIENHKCVDLLAFWYFNASFNIVTDIAVVALPLYVLRDLHLPRRQKWAVTGIFAVGVITCITSIVRLRTIYTLLHQTDYTYNNAEPAMWSSVEVNTAIVCACMQSLKPLVQKSRPQWLLQSESSSNATASSSDTLKLGYVKPIGNLNIEAVETRDLSVTEPVLLNRSQ